MKKILFAAVLLSSPVFAAKPPINFAHIGGPVSAISPAQIDSIGGCMVQLTSAVPSPDGQNLTVFIPGKQARRGRLGDFCESVRSGDYLAVMAELRAWYVPPHYFLSLPYASSVHRITR